MIWQAALLLILFLPLPLSASHTWADIDLCEVYKDKLPPGLTPESLPEAHSQGAELVNRYCSQCHNLPAPDRHTTTEWQGVAANMFMLMDLSNRFGGLMGRVETMQQQEQEIVLAYLARHATNAGRGRSQTTLPDHTDPASLQGLTPTPEADDEADDEAAKSSWLTPTLPLLPFLLLMGLGLLRWWRTPRSGHKPCVID
ncbi:MAG: hypothetical protein ABW166_02260 [Sedimenticola sp.]